MNEFQLFQVCYLLAQEINSSNTNTPVDDLPAQIAGHSDLAETLTQIAKARFWKVEDLPDGFDILLGAIRYLGTQALPPLERDLEWFDNSLGTLLELCRPTHIYYPSSIPFFISLQKGILSSISQAAAEPPQDQSGE